MVRDVQLQRGTAALVRRPPHLSHFEMDHIDVSRTSGGRDSREAFQLLIAADPATRSAKSDALHPIFGRPRRFSRVSFVLGAVILAATVNLVAGLGGGK